MTDINKYLNIVKRHIAIMDGSDEEAIIAVGKRASDITTAENSLYILAIIGILGVYPQHLVKVCEQILVASEKEETFLLPEEAKDLKTVLERFKKEDYWEWTTKGYWEVQPGENDK